MVANKTRSIAVTVVLWCLPGLAFGLATAASGTLVGLAASILGVIAARAILPAPSLSSPRSPHACASVGPTVTATP